MYEKGLKSQGYQNLNLFFHCFIFKLLFQIVHDCASHLYTCYTHEEINETKVGQLELTKQVTYHNQLFVYVWPFPKELLIILFFWRIENNPVLDGLILNCKQTAER